MKNRARGERESLRTKLVVDAPEESYASFDARPRGSGDADGVDEVEACNRLSSCASRIKSLDRYVLSFSLFPYESCDVWRSVV